MVRKLVEKINLQNSKLIKAPAADQNLQFYYFHLLLRQTIVNVNIFKVRELFHN